MRDDPEKLHAIADAGGLRPRPKGCLEIALAGNGDAELRDGRAFNAAAASIKYSNPFFLTRRPTAKTSGYIIRDARAVRGPRPRVCAPA